MTDYGRLSDEQALVDLVPNSAARSSFESAVVDLTTSGVARSSFEGVLVDWVKAPDPFNVRFLSAMAMVEWRQAHESGRITTQMGLTEWSPIGQGRLLGAVGIIEWVPGNTMTMDSARIVIRTRDGSAGQGIEHRELADMALAEIEFGGVRGTKGPSDGGDGDGFPLNGTPGPGPSVHSVARYPAPNSSPSWEA